MLSYKANGTALGVLEDPSQTAATVNSPVVNPSIFTSTQLAQYSLSRQQLFDMPPSPPRPTLLKGFLLSARVFSFHYKSKEYWFRVHAFYRPFGPSDSSTLRRAKQLVLSRTYNDFFDFQIALLDTFPREGGRETKHPRIIPFLPRPSDQVDDLLTATTELDDYLRRLYRLNRTTARYILEHHLTREFFALKPGDTEVAAEPQYDRMAEVGWYDPSEDPKPVSIDDPPLEAPTISVRNPQVAFIKIKVFDMVQDDVIVIRVPPRVTHEQLLDKVQQRLGGQVARLSYREYGEHGRTFVLLQQDDDVLWWIGSTDEHVLYTD